jgi:hypothetical protein
MYRNYLYIFGGFDGYSSLRSVEKSDLSSPEPTFTLLPSDSHLMDPFKNGAAALHNDTIYLVGGWNESDTSKSVFSYCPAKDKCEFVCQLPERVEGHSLVKAGHYVFIIGGFDGFGVTDRIMRFDLNTFNVNVLPTKLL